MRSTVAIRPSPTIAPAPHPTTSTSPPSTTPTVTGLSPSSGSINGQFFALIRGTNLLGARVKIGTLNAQVTNVTPDGYSITFIVPPGSTGTVAVTVSTPRGSVGVPGGFTYQILGPTVSSMTPTSGPASGKNLIIFRGTNLDTATVSVGGIVANVNAFSSDGTVISVFAPPGAPGPATVTVSGGGGTVTVPGGYTYVSS